MVVKNVTVDYAFIGRPDDNENYRLTFYVNDEQKAQIEAELKRVLPDPSISPDWWGSYKEHDDGRISFSAKASSSFTNKKGEQVETKLKVYNKRAQLLEDVPSVKNGAIMNVEVEAYYAKYKNKQGAMLGLRSVQLLEYEIYEGGNPYVDEESSYDPA